MAGLVHDQNREKRMGKQIGCMSGFLHIFDRQQILAGKRIHSTKRLPPSTGVGASPGTTSSVESHEFSGELRKAEPPKHVAVVPVSSQISPPENVNGPSIATPQKSPTFKQKDETQKFSWKSSKEMHRLSLDSRAIVDSKGSLRPRDVRTNNSVILPNGADGKTSVADGDDKQRRSPSVVARLMGLETLSSSDHKTQQPVPKPTLRRSASESRLSRDLVRSKYIDGNNFQVKQPSHSQKQSVENVVSDEGSNVSHTESVNGSVMKSMGYVSRNLKSESPRTSPWRSPQQRKGYFDSADFFPEPNQMTISMHEDFERKRKKRGMDEQSNDLGTLKQILDVLQLKGLLHSSRSPNRDSRRNFVYDRNLLSDESSIVLMKPWLSPASKVDNQRPAHHSRGARGHATENSQSISPKQTGVAVDRSRRSPVRARNSSPPRIESNLKSCNSIVKRKPLSIEIQRRANESSDSLKSSPVNSPKLPPKRTAHHSSKTRSPRNHKQTESSSSSNSPKQMTIKNVADDESSSISESTVSTPSTTDTERCIEGRSLLHRCDKESKAERNSSSESQPSSATVIPSPVSVLDSGLGFDKDEASSPSHSIDFKVVDMEEKLWNPSILSTKSTEREEFISDDSDFIYISELLRALPHLQEDCNLFFSLEKQLHNNKDTSNVSKRQRKLVFDVIHEIIDKKRDVPPWKASYADSGTYLKQIWSEFQKIRAINIGDGLLELIGGVLKKDLVEINEWEDHIIEKSETILDIERMIFKDLVCEAIRDFVEFSHKRMFSRPQSQRKLVF